MNKILKIISNIIFYMILIFLLIIFIYNKFINKENIPRVFNYYIFEVVSGSMEQEIHVGDYIIVKKTEDYDVDDVVTYKKDNYYITHRIIKIEDEKVTTKGDANNLEDEEIDKKDIVGKYIRKSNLIKYIIKYKYLIISILLITVLLGNKKEKEVK